MKQGTCRAGARGVRAAVAAALAAAVLLSGCAPIQKAEKQLSSFADGKMKSAVSAVESEASAETKSLLESSQTMQAASSSANSRVSSKPSAAASSTVPKKATAVPKVKNDVKTVKKINTALPAKTVAKKEISTAPVASGSYTSVQQAGAYQNLSDAEKQLYSLIKNSVYQIALQPVSGGYYPIGQIWVSQKLSEAQIRVSLTAFMDDNPKVFWLADAYTYAYDGSTTIVQLFSVLPVTDAQTELNQLNSAADSILQAMPSGLNDFDREEYLFNYITSHCSYDNAAVTDTSRWQAFTSYGALTGGLAVCEGYAKAMQLLAGYAGLTCTVVHGSSEGVGHMWNAIVINGKWYNLDVTWCDNSILIYNYYNIPDSVLKLTHTIGSPASALSDAQICTDDSQYNVFLPSCVSTAENYFRVKGISASSKTDPADSTVIQTLAEKMKSGSASLAFYIDGTPYDSQVNAVLNEKMYRWLTAAAARAGVAINTGSLNYVTDQSDSGLTVHVVYR